MKKHLIGILTASLLITMMSTGCSQSNLTASEEKVDTNLAASEEKVNTNLTPSEEKVNSEYSGDTSEIENINPNSPDELIHLTPDVCRKYKGRISATNDYLLGVKSDGTVVMAGNDGYIDTYEPIISEWSDIVSICAEGPIALRNDGTVVSCLRSSNRAYFQLQEWNDIIEIASNGTTFVGLKSDHTVVFATSWEDEEAIFQDVNTWTDIVDIAIGSACIVGLKSDGTVVAISEDSNDDPVNFVEEWSDIVAVGAGEMMTYMV